MFLAVSVCVYVWSECVCGLTTMNHSFVLFKSNQPTKPNQPSQPTKQASKQANQLLPITQLNSLSLIPSHTSKTRPYIYIPYITHNTVIGIGIRILGSLLEKTERKPKPMGESNTNQMVYNKIYKTYIYTNIYNSTKRHKVFGTAQCLWTITTTLHLVRKRSPSQIGYPWWWEIEKERERESFELYGLYFFFFVF